MNEALVENESWEPQGQVRVTGVEDPNKQRLVGELGMLWSSEHRDEVVFSSGERITRVHGHGGFNFEKVFAVEESGVTKEGEVYYGTTVIGESEPSEHLNAR